MKKLFLFAVAAFAMLATSCSKDADVVAPVEKGTVTFAVATPQLATRAKIGDGETATTLHYAVYDENWNHLEAFYGTKEINISTTVQFDLVDGKTYNFLFWAQNAAAPYTFNPDTKKVTVDYAGIKSNNEQLDAFFAPVEGVKVSASLPQQNVDLYRPFAQLNIATSDWALFTASEETFSKTEVKVWAYDTLDLVSGNVTNGAERTFTMNTMVTEAFAYDGKSYKWLSMNYLLVDDKELVKVTFNAENDNVSEKVWNNVPVERNYRTNIIGSLLTSTTDFKITIRPDFIEPPYELEPTAITTNAELEATLTANEAVISVTMGADLQVKGAVAEKLGGADTKYIIIDGKKLSTATTAVGADTTAECYKLTIDDDYMPVLQAVNPDAIIVLKNLVLTNNKPEGTWDIYDIIVKNDIEMENVVVEKALALNGEGMKATLKNVTIKESHDYYAMWISPVGQTITLEDCEIISAGRAIKIDQQYVDAPAKVVLNVKNSKFTSAKKAAILVETKAGAEINIEGIDITNVAADSVNAVWVDEDAVAYYNLVEVTGAQKVLEGAEYVAEGILLKDGVYLIMNATGMADVAKNYLKNGGSFSLEADIDMTGVKYEVTSGSKEIKFDGKNHTISGVTMENTVQAALFGDNNMYYIKNLTVANSTFTGQNVDGKGSAAAFLGFTEAHSSYTSKLENCHVVNCTIGHAKYVGGLIAFKDGSGNTEIKNCSVNYNTIISDYTEDGGVNYKGHCGGVIGYFASPVTISETTVSGNIFDTKGPRCGLFIGSANYDITVSGTVKLNEGLIALCGNINKISDWTKVNFIDGVFEGVKDSITKGEDVIFTEDVAGESSKGGYSEAGVAQTNGGVIDGGGNTLTVSGANGTWDCAIYTKGGTIKNLTINGAFRGIFTADQNEDIIVENVVLDDVCYTFSADDGNGQHYVHFTNSTLNGWTSYSNVFKGVTFTGCKFGQGTGGYKYAFCRPYNVTVFTDCDFEAGFEVDPVGKCTFVNCRLDGVTLTAENIGTLVTSNVQNAVVE